MNMPRILMFGEQFYPRIGGAERQAQKLAEALIEKGCEVQILTPQHDRAWSLRETLNGLTVNRFTYRDLSRSVVGLRGIGVPNTLFLGMQVKSAVRQLLGSFDILHAHIASPMVVYAMQAAQDAGKRAICKIACGGLIFDLESTAKTSMIGPYLVRRALAKMDAWIAISEEIRQDLMDYGAAPEAIVRIPNGVDSSATARAQTQNSLARRFLYLGRLGSNRDFATLLRAFDILAAEIPGCELRMVGGGEREIEVRHLLGSLKNAARQTKMLGFTDPAKWLQWADVVVQPSLAEGLSNTLLEAMAGGICCIANDIPPNREVLANGEAGVLVEVGDVAALALAMKRIATTPMEATRWGVLGQQRVAAAYSMNRIAGQYLNLYQQLLAEADRTARPN